MKLIVAGSTGFIGTEVIRQALLNPAITSLVGLSRRPTAVPDNAESGAAKLKSVIVEDFENYTETVKKEFAVADACIWLIAVLPSASLKLPVEETRKICLDYLVTGLDTISELPRTKENPTRFIYASGAKVDRNQTTKPWILGDYSLLRAEVERHVLSVATESDGAIEACIAKPGFIGVPAGRQGPVMSALGAFARSSLGVPSVDVKEVAATLLEQAIRGIEKETLSNEDLARIGKRVLTDQQK